MKNYLLLSTLPMAALIADNSAIITNRPNSQSPQSAPKKPVYYPNETEECDEPQPCMKEAAPKREMTPMVPASARPKICDGLNVVLLGDFLYMQAREDNLEVGYQPTSSSTNLDKGSIHSIGSHYDPGFRVGIGFLLPHDQWDLYFKWTRFDADHHASIPAVAGESVYALMLNLFEDPRPSSVSASWTIHLNTGDLEIGRSFYAGRFLSLRPFIGARAAWLSQDIDASYGNVTYQQGTVGTVASVDLDNDSMFRGWGLRLGLDTDWEMGAGWSLYLNGAASLLWSHFAISQVETLSTGVKKNDVKNNFHTVSPVLEMTGGLSWGCYLFKHRYYIQLHAGWEEQFWYAQNRFGRMVDDSNAGSFVFNEGNFSLSGLNVGARFVF